MNKFNLTFSGEILPGENPEQVKLRFAEMFSIDDPDRLEKFFSGESIILRRNMERKDAAQCYADLRNLGVAAALVKVTAAEAADRVLTPARSSAKPPKSAKPSGRAKKARPAKKAKKQPTKREVREEEQLSLPLENALAAPEQSKSVEEEVTREKKKKAAARARRARAEKKKRQEAEAAARILAEEKEREASEKAEKAARLLAEKQQREEAEKAARLLAAKQAREKAENAARLLAEKQEREETEKAARLLAEKKEREAESAKRRAREHQPLGPKQEKRPRQGPSAAIQKKKKSKAKPVKSTLDLPQRKSTKAPNQPENKRQRGEPNFYQIEPFRNTAAIRSRPETSARRARRDLLIGIASGIAFMAVALLGLQLRSPEPVTPIDVVAADDRGQLVIASGNWLALHNRAGTETETISLAELGLRALQPPLAFSSTGELLTFGSRQNASDIAMLRCQLQARQCAVLNTPAPADSIVAFAENPIDGSLFFLSRDPDLLAQVALDGTVLSSAPLTLPPTPSLQLDSGLLLINSKEAPAINVFRYDANAFGKQLDQILVLPPPALADGQTQVTHFIRTDDRWWVTMQNPDSGSKGLYQFDSQWEYLGTAPVDPNAVGLAAWGQKLLVNLGTSLSLERISSDGLLETPFEPEGLVARAQDNAASHGLAQTVLQAALVGFSLTAVFFLLSAYHQNARALVYGPKRERGAPPLDSAGEDSRWVSPSQNRTKRLKRVVVGYAAVATASVLGGIGAGINAIQLGALLLALVGPLIAWRLIQTAPVGHVGVNDGMLVLADHRGVYQHGAGSQIARRNNFLILDDVVVHCGGALIPAFETGHIRDIAMPLARSGVRVDRKTLLVKLLEGRHPFARGAVMAIGCFCAALAIWLSGLL